MSKILRAAIEEAETNKEVILSGPLSTAYTEALNDAYKKEATPLEVNDPETGEVTIQNVVATETQAEDLANLERLSRLSGNNVGAPLKERVYAVSKTDVNIDTIIDVSTMIAESKEKEKGVNSFAVIIDETLPTNTEENPYKEVLVNLSSALESIVVASGGKCFTSLKDYASSL